MKRGVPWASLISLIEQPYPTSVRVGRQPIGVPRALRAYRLQHWHGLDDEALEDALYDHKSLRDSISFGPTRESESDAATLLKRRCFVANQRHDEGAVR